MKKILALILLLIPFIGLTQTKNVVDSTKLKQNEINVVFGVIDGIKWLFESADGEIKEIKSEREEMESNLNTKVKLDGKELTVVEYSFINKTYTLSNGVSINEKLYEKIKIKND